jgi:D-alanine--poly(phosphoribitol) ligase subunit 2
MREREVVEERLSGLFCEKFGLDIASVETDLIETGVLDSLKLVELLLELEQLFEMKIPLNDLEIDTFRSIAHIADLVMNDNGLSRTAGLYSSGQNAAQPELKPNADRGVMPREIRSL